MPRKDPEARKAYEAARRVDPERRASVLASGRKYRLKKRYDLTLEDYDAILAGQGGVCAICGRAPKETKLLAVDHDHKTGQVRGLLCWLCNTALGKFKDNHEQLQRAADYVRNPPATQHLGREVYGAKGRVTNKRRARKARRRTT